MAPEEDEDEWEYEYSTTETETYYLTLDLSIRDFLERRTEDVVHNTRAGYRVWFNPLYTDTIPKHPTDSLYGNGNAGNGANTRTGNQDQEGDDEGTADVDLDKIASRAEQADAAMPIDPLLQDSTQARKDVLAVGGTREPEQRAPEEIQILDLHTEEPIVSYKNHFFKGSWAANVGTELIFTRHNPKVPIPALRHLPQNVDLLAASSARINFREITVKSPGDDGNGGTLQDRNTAGGVPAGDYDDEDELYPTVHDPVRDIGAYNNENEVPERYKENGGVYVHVGGDKTGQRQPQAHFLEDLITIKRKRGEADDVTIAPRETRQNHLMVQDEEEEMRRRKIQRDYERLQRWKANGGSSGQVGEYIPRQPVGRPRRGRGSRPRARRAYLIRREDGDDSRPSFPAHPVASQEFNGGSVANSMGGAQGDDGSTPTPKNWDDVVEGGKK